MNKFNDIDNDRIVELLECDDIRRNQYLKRFLKILCYNGSNQIISLDGEWGSGKTTFIKKLEFLINYFSFYENGEQISNHNYINNNIELSESLIEKMEKLSQNGEYSEIKQLVRDINVNAIYFNAWEHDDEIDPILSIIYTIINNFDLLASTKKYDSGNFLDKVSSLINLLSLGTVNINSPIKERDLVQSIRLKEEIKLKLQEVLDDIITENCQKLVIFVDELDRCKPDYSISLLERIRHYFNDERIVIVLTTNIKELINIINTRYGNEFSSAKYLDKFIDERLFLPDIKLDNYLSTFKSNIREGDSTWYSIVITHFIKSNNLQMREITHYLECMRHFEKIAEVDPFENHLRIIYRLFIPFMVGLHITSPIKFNQFRSGDGFELLKEFVFSNKLIQTLCKRCFYSTEQDKDAALLQHDLKRYYELIFKQKDKNASIDIENYKVYKEVIPNIDDKISLLGDIAVFQENENS